MEFHLSSVEEVARQLKSHSRGLTEDDAAVRLRISGKNTIQVAKKKIWWKLLLSQFSDFMVLALLAAAIISGFVGDVTDMIVILAIVVINAVVGFLQEWKAEKAMEVLQAMASSKAKVIRNKSLTEVDAAYLVPGDVVIVEAGNIIPADLRFIESHSLQVDESSLTGESTNVEKQSRELPYGAYALADRNNIGYRGTIITHGRATAYVIATGMNTELGKIAGMIQVEESGTPLQKKLTVLGRQLTIGILVLALTYFTIGMIHGSEWSALLLITISLAVAAIPEALPALVTVALALGAKRLVKSNALIRKLSAVETLGAVAYICLDKTGTLTSNKMKVQEAYRVASTNLPIHLDNLIDDIFLFAMSLNNDVTLADGTFAGESTEVALAEYASENGYDKNQLELQFPRVGELPFDSNRKCMTTLHKVPQGVLALTKGAVDELELKLVPGQQKFVHELKHNFDRMAKEGHRILGFAYRLFPEIPKRLTPEEVETSLTFIGLAGMIDPPRGEVRQVVQEAKQAGITPVMITGDYKLTAQAIAEKLGIFTPGQGKMLSGSELDQLSDHEFEQMVEDVRVYARVSPLQKLRIIEALQKKKHIIAMTGDGVNDAPALRKADIGVAMGINGTQVSREAADMILLDDNFSTILVAVKHGRKIYDNITKFIKYILTGNSGELWPILLAPLFGLPVPFLPIQILWVNLITDGMPALALASEPAETATMSRPPRNPEEKLFSAPLILHIVFVGLLIGALTLGVQALTIGQSNNHWQTITFTVLCFAQLFHAIAIRSTSRSTFKVGLFSNRAMVIAILVTVMLQMIVVYSPLLNKVFHTQPLTLTELLAAISIASIVFWILESAKFIETLLKTRNFT